MFDGVQLVRGGVAAFARKLPLWVVGPRAARDVDVATAEMAASFEGRRRRRDAVYDNTWRQKVRVLRDGDGENKHVKSEAVSLMHATSDSDTWTLMALPRLLLFWLSDTVTELLQRASKPRIPPTQSPITHTCIRKHMKPLRRTIWNMHLQVTH